MARGARPIGFRDYLPEIFRSDEVNGVSFLSRYLRGFEILFEELEQEIEGAPDRSHGGIPDLFDPATTPPPEFRYRRQPDADFLHFLASWIALPLRSEKPIDAQRAFFHAALPLYRGHGTLPGMEALLRAWLKGDLWETTPPLLILTDLTPADNGGNAIFRLAETATLGVDTVLGEGPAFFFIVDLVTDPTVRELRDPVGLDLFRQAARSLLDAEKPAHTYYELRVRSHTMQLAPEREQDRRPGEIYAQLEDLSSRAPLTGTTLLWDEPWVLVSDC
jgi:phage tail-like protein